MEKWMQIVDYIFKNKHLYRTLTDKDKIDSFYIINHKFSKNYPQIAIRFNNKSIDKATAIDLWFNHFKKYTSIPGWYYEKSTTKKEKESKIPKADKELFMEYEGIKEEDFNFLLKHFPEDVEYEIKKLKRFDK